MNKRQRSMASCTGDSADHISPRTGPSATACAAGDSAATSLVEFNTVDAGATTPPRTVFTDPSSHESAAELMVSSSPVSNSVHITVHPPSPASNRERFRASQMPCQVTCDLSTIAIEPGLRFTFQGIVLVVFPASTNPARRHVLVGDGRGVVGITVWNAHVNSFSSESIGQLLVVTKVSVVLHNGSRGITLNKESSVQFNSLVDHFATVWWLSIPRHQAVSAILFNEQKDNAVVNVAGIVGSVSAEQKTVRSDARDLVTIKIVDRTGIITLRTWNHHSDMFISLVDAPVMFRRVRVTSFAGQKSGELFDGSGTIIEKDSFTGADDLKKFWSE
jgi:hypothetical protein